MTADASQTTTETPETRDRELEVLQELARNRDVHQRDISRIVGVSLGMTNAILKRLARKGLISIRKVNNRNIKYVVSPAGFEEIAKRSYRYLRRTVRNVVVYKEAIEGLVETVGHRGYTAIILVGQSDLDFIVEHACRTNGIGFRSTSDSPSAPGTDEFILHSEQTEPHRPQPTADSLEEPIRTGEAQAFLGNILL